MGVEYTIEGALVRTRAHGVVTHEEFLAHAREIRDDPAVSRPLRELWNGLDLESLEIFGAHIREVLHMVSTSGPFAGARLAVVTRDPAVHGMARMAQALSRPKSLEIRIYASVAEAEAWLTEPVAFVAQGGGP